MVDQPSILSHRDRRVLPDRNFLLQAIVSGTLVSHRAIWRAWIDTPNSPLRIIAGHPEADALDWKSERQGPHILRSLAFGKKDNCPLRMESCPSAKPLEALLIT